MEGLWSLPVILTVQGRVGELLVSFLGRVTLPSILSGVGTWVGRRCQRRCPGSGKPTCSKAPWVLDGAARALTGDLSGLSLSLKEVFVPQPRTRISGQPSLGWLLGGCWENPSVREKEVWIEITKRSQFFSALCSSLEERLQHFHLLSLLFMKVKKQSYGLACADAWAPNPETGT